jgi:hypothetical protein
MKKIIYIFLLIFLLNSNSPFVLGADVENITLHIKNGNEVIYSNNVEINQEDIDVVDSASTTHTIKRDNVLGALAFVDGENDSFEITKLDYYSFGFFLMINIHLLLLIELL